MRLIANHIRERIEDTLITTLKIEFIETDDETTLEAIMPVGMHNSQTRNVLHGGATIVLAESVAGVGSNAICAEGESSFGIQVSANHISSAKMGDTVRAKGKIVHKGRSTHVWKVDVFSEADGRLISTLLITNAVLKKKF
ncbi:PaaI family thioesterase [Dysgonomonas sp. 216]|uniref:PaaI family thioesterase n=1 Tax=Dysgonomonas sp. 216 TaxID=2302934 RepID=UPI0013D1B807|nr:PaaI family thioesterase [Dysgonomonas sp. 216]NDW18514.1 PaaI family thioesterase [Dysgonomonas sp. 216]